VEKYHNPLVAERECKKYKVNFHR